MRTVPVIPNRGIAVSAQDAQLVFARVTEPFQFGVERIATRWATKGSAVTMTASVYVVKVKKLCGGFTTASTSTSIFTDDFHANAPTKVTGSFSQEGPPFICRFMRRSSIFVASYPASALLADRGPTVQPIALKTEFVPQFEGLALRTRAAVVHEVSILRGVAFCWLFGTMMDLPKGWPMYCRDIKQWADDLGNPPLPEQSSTEHNALADARWNREAWKYLRDYAEDTVSVNDGGGPV